MSEQQAGWQPKPSPNQQLQAFNSMMTCEATQKYLTQILSDRKNTLVNNLVALVSGSAQLQKCDRKTILYAGLKSAALNLPLDPNLGYCYIIPYKTYGGMVAQFQIGWKGFYQLALRSNKYKTVNVRDVRQGEIIGEDFMSGELQFKSLPIESRLQSPVVGYLAYIELLPPQGQTCGFHKSLFMSVTEIQNHAATYSKSYSTKLRNPEAADSVWNTNFDAMAKKTVLKLLLSKYGPVSIETTDLQNGLASDQASISGDKLTYADNKETTANDQFAPEQTDDAKIMEAIEVETAKTETAAEAANIMAQAK